MVTIDGKDIYLGKHDTAESKAAYDRLIGEWLRHGRRLPKANAAAEVSIASVIEQFWPWVEMNYRRPDGTQTSEVDQYRYGLRPLNYLHGTTPAIEFGPLAFQAVRQLMIDGYEHPKYGYQPPVSRGVINKRMSRIKRMFRWAVSREMIPSVAVVNGQHQAIQERLKSVDGLQRGRSKARETEPVRPVAEAIVNASRPFLSRPVEALIDLQLLTGARPGELCILRECDLDMSGRIWVYRPEFHKTTHRGLGREIYLGPKAQEIVKPFFKPFVKTAYLFSPQDADAEHQEERRQNRKTPLWPSHLRRLEKKRKANRRRPPSDHYDVPAFRRAIAYACLKAFPLPEHLGPRTKANGKRETAKEWKKRLTTDEKAAIKVWKRQHTWHPHQLRHSSATALRKEFGIELARIILGHSSAFVTEIYAECDRVKAMEAMQQVG